MQYQVKLRAGKYKVPVTITEVDGRNEFKFAYNLKLMDEIRNLQGRKWHGRDEPTPRKIWSAPITPRNTFVLNYLQGEDVFADYDRQLIDMPTNPKADGRPELWKHQQTQVQHMLTRKKCLLAADMGTGKTRSFIEAAEILGFSGPADVWYIGPKSGVKAVTMDLHKWKTDINPRMITYEGLVRLVKTWTDDTPGPKFIVFDESSKIKTPEAQRSQAAMHVAEWVRSQDVGYVIEMSGTPAPKSPIDWWHQAEIACPGFLKESSPNALRKRLSLIEERESATGGVYPHLITWLDDENKCSVCGKYEIEHMDIMDHVFSKSVNEVAKLYERLKGLVLIQKIDDCLDLPDIIYQPVNLKPEVSTVRLVNTLRKTETRAISFLTKARQLSDGFQYIEVPTHKETCELCHGNKKIVESALQTTTEAWELAAELPATADGKQELVICPHCGGDGEVQRYRRDITEIPTPKDEQLANDLDMHSDVGRIIIWGGFTGTVDKLVNLCKRYGWTVLRVDGRGYHGFTPDGEQIDSDELLRAMDYSHPDRQHLMHLYPKIAFVGQPKAGGMALTLTMAPTTIYYSNDFDGEARAQSERRFKRGGMKLDRPITVIDYYHLVADKVVVNNLKKKRKLENMTMGQLDKEWEAVES